MFTSGHEAFWARARKALGDSAGTRALIEVLLAHRHLEHADLLAGITAALSVGSVSPDVVAVEASKTAQRRGVQPLPVEATHHVGSRSSASPPRGWSSCPTMTGRCARSTSMTTCSKGQLRSPSTNAKPGTRRGVTKKECRWLSVQPIAV